MVKVAIVGVSGYSGGVACEILLNHPEVRITYVSANDISGKVEDAWPHLKGKTELSCTDFDLNKALDLCEVVFLAVPHTVSMAIAPALLKAQKRVIDFSADYRFKDANVYKSNYGVAHKDKANLSKAVYGLPELYREDIKNAYLIANPGCYPTAAILALSPVVATNAKAIQSITIDAKSGVTGAGRKVAQSLLFGEVNESVKAYKILKHQHAPEIDQYLSKLGDTKVTVDFVPHLVPINRGILETIYVRFKGEVDLANILSVYKKFYKTEKFVRVLDEGHQPEIKNVAHTNYCDIGISVDAEKKLLVLTSAIDNLMKGAAGQAVQNLNIMCDFKETLGLL